MFCWMSFFDTTRIFPITPKAHRRNIPSLLPHGTSIPIRLQSADGSPFGSRHSTSASSPRRNLPSHSGNNTIGPRGSFLLAQPIAVSGSNVPGCSVHRAGCLRTKSKLVPDPGTRVLFPKPLHLLDGPFLGGDGEAMTNSFSMLRVFPSPISNSTGPRTMTIV